VLCDLCCGPFTVRNEGRLLLGNATMGMRFSLAAMAKSPAVPFGRLVGRTAPRGYDLYLRTVYELRGDAPR
jgi:hypothetical protein